MDLDRKLAILADAAKYDASCASSGTTTRSSVGGKGLGSTEGAGICHSYAPDGRCISLLKILLTNYCLYDCLYCVNRVSSNVPRARFTSEEVVRLTLDFYRRNCIEGLFLSSGIIQSPDHTMEQVVEVARSLREDHDFRGYIHLKTIPEASPELLARAGRYADRLSINVELPTADALHSLAPEKDGQAIRRSMARLRIHIDDAKEAAKPVAVRSQAAVAPRRARSPVFAPAGQSTQMIVGADATDDRSILTTSATLYGAYRLRRVYYSAFSPIPDAPRSLPSKAPPLMREHRLYQADWLMRFYGFAHDEIVSAPSGMLALDIDPKLAWALAHRDRFPVDLDTAPKELLLRVPGLGVKAVERLLQTRRVRPVRSDDLARLRVPLKTVLPFVKLPGQRSAARLDAADLAARLRPAPQQARCSTLRSRWPSRPDGTMRRVRLAGEADVDGFRRAARRLLTDGVEPSDVAWQATVDATDDLFADAADVAAPVSTAPAAPVAVPAFFVPLCERAALHADPGRFALLYRLLWRLVHEPGLRGDPLDPDRVAAEAMARTVRREMHKMTAFVRFRPIADDAAQAGPEDAALPALGADAPDDPVAFEALFAAEPPVQPSPRAQVDSRWHVAWFEPAHHVVEATAPFFVRRFAQMRWAILTPERSARWDGERLAFGPGARRDEAPPADAGERLWLTYYEHIFNPARLKLAAMKKEMPRRYWPNLPEAALIRPLTEQAGSQTDRMVDAGGTESAKRRPRASAALRLDVLPSAPVDAAPPASLADVKARTQACRECPIGALATQSVTGVGDARARLMLVGEQPGDQEDLRGRPFVGPAGQLLDRALKQLGWPRDAVFLTNAVKHFKYELRGTRRIHKTPAQREVAACLHWLESEIGLVQPEAAIALGATAARALMGRAVGVTSERGRWLRRDDGLRVLITLHPSALLRMEPSERDAAFDRWLEDLHLASACVHSRGYGTDAAG